MNAAETPKLSLTLQVSPEREQLVCACYEKLGYRVNGLKRSENADTRIDFELEDAKAFNQNRMIRSEEILSQLFEIDRKVNLYYLKRVCLVGLAGAACIGFSFVPLHAKIHWLFTVLLLFGIFGCTITLSLRPVLTRMGRIKHGSEESALRFELQNLLGLDGGEAA